LLADKKRTKLPVTSGGDELTVSLPKDAPDSIDSVIVLELNQ